MVAVRERQPFDERDAEFLAVRAPAETDRAAGLVDQQRVARELAHVLLDEGEPAGGLAAGDRRQRLHVLPLAPRRAADQPARALDRRLRRGAVALEERDERRARVRERELTVARHRGGERLIGAVAVREQSVHAGLIVLGGDGRRGGEGQPVTVRRAHR